MNSDLEQATLHDDVERVRQIVSHGVDYDELNHNDTTPLVFAIRLHNVEMAKILIEAKSDVNYATSDCWYTPIHSAAINESSECMKLLLQYKANPHVLMKNGCTPLHFAAECSMICTQILIDAGCDVSVVDKRNRTPIYCSIRHTQVGSTALLLDKGAKVIYNKVYPDWLNRLLDRRKNIKNVIMHFVALAKRTKVVHKDLIKTIGRFIWDTRDDYAWNVSTTIKKNKN